MSLPRVITQFNLNRNQTRVSRQEIVLPVTRRVLKEWIKRTIESDKHQALPTPGLAPFACRFVATADSLLGTITGISTAHNQAELIPLLLFGVAANSAGTAVVWPALHEACPEPKPSASPREPWTACVFLPGLKDYPFGTEWFFDFEQCVAWVWLEMREDAQPRWAPYAKTGD